MAAVPSRLTRAATAVAAALLLAADLIHGSPHPAQTRPATPAASAVPRRIISLIPATTEMLFTIGAADRLVAVGNYDRHPPEVEQLPRVGGLLNPNVERILSFKPDLVVVYETQVELKALLERAGIPMFRYVHRGLPDIPETMRALGARVGLQAAGEAAASQLEQQLAARRAGVAGRPRPRTLLVIGREPGSLRHVIASGGYGFLHDLLEAAGGANVFADSQRPSLQLSTETILARAPEVIIEVHERDGLTAPQVESERKVWSALASVPAVRTRRVHLLVGDEFVVPGPRVFMAAERFAAVLHGDAVASR